MRDSTKMDYSKLLGFDMVADDVADGVDFQHATIGAKLGAKVGKTVTKTPLLMPSTEEVTPAAVSIMRGLGGRTVTRT